MHSVENYFIIAGMEQHPVNPENTTKDKPTNKGKKYQKSIQTDLSFDELLKLTVTVPKPEKPKDS